VFGLAAARRLRGVGGDRYSAGNGSWTTLLMVVITMCLCSAAAAVAAEHPIIPVDPHAKLPPMGCPNEFQVIEPRSFTAEQWQRFFQEARLALGVNETGSEHVTFATEFDMQGAQKLGWVLHRDTRSLYARIQKCANNAIRLMLFAQYAGRKLPDETISLAWERAGNLIVPAEVRRGSGVAEYSGKALPPGPDALQDRTWTFVRNPLSHFVSGFTQSWVRSHPGQVEQLERGEIVAPYTVEDFRHFLGELLTGKAGALLPGPRPLSHVVYGAHFMPMTELLAQQPRVAVGRLEHMEEHWAAMQTWLGMEEKSVVAWNRSRAALADHDTSKDPLGSAVAAKTAIAQDPAIAKALCFMHLPDFINFGYTLPPVCKEDGRMRALLEEYLDAPTEMVLASDQQAGPQPTLKTMQELFLDADKMGDLKRERLASRDPEMAQKLDLIKKGQADIEKRGLSPRRIEKAEL